MYFMRKIFIREHPLSGETSWLAYATFSLVVASAQDKKGVSELPQKLLGACAFFMGTHRGTKNMMVTQGVTILIIAFAVRVCVVPERPPVVIRVQLQYQNA